MKKYKARIKFTVDYLQAKLTTKAKGEITKTVKKSGAECPISANDPNDLLYYDSDIGCYIPSEQIVGALINSGKDFKIKAQRRSYKEFVKAKIFVYPDKIPLGKQTYDSTILSHPKRKDGSRVPLIHPLFFKGTEAEFFIECLDKTQIDDEILHELLKNAGSTYGIGGRYPRWGRFEVIEFSKVD